MLYANVLPVVESSTQSQSSHSVSKESWGVLPVASRRVLPSKRSKYDVSALLARSGTMGARMRRDRRAVQSNPENHAWFMIAEAPT